MAESTIIQVLWQSITPYGKSKRVCTFVVSIVTVRKPPKDVRDMQRQTVPSYLSRDLNSPNTKAKGGGQTNQIPSYCTVELCNQSNQTKRFTVTWSWGFHQSDAASQYKDTVQPIKRELIVHGSCATNQTQHQSFTGYFISKSSSCNWFEHNSLV